jgi:Transposase DDE domain
LHRSFFAAYQERVKGYQQTLAYQKAMSKRKVWVEPLFAEGKDWHGMRRFRLRRLWRVNCEALVLASGQNLKRLLQKRGWGRRPFPTEAGAKVPPPAWKSDETSRDPLKSRSVSVLVACLISCDAIRKCFWTHKNPFSLKTIVYPIFIYFLIYIIFSLFPFFLLYLLQEDALRHQAHTFFVSSAKSFSTGWAIS